MEGISLPHGRLMTLAALIYRANPNKSIKILEKRERGRIQGLPKFLEYPLIIAGTGYKATDFTNFIATFIGSIGTKAHEKCWQ